MMDSLQLLNDDPDLKTYVLLDYRLGLKLHALGLNSIAVVLQGNCSVDFSLPFLPGGKGLPWDKHLRALPVGTLPCVTALLASGSAFVALVPVSLPLVRPGKQPGMSQLPSSRQPSLHGQQRVPCSQGRRCRHRARCPCPWGARPVGRAGRARCRGRGGHRRPHGLHFAVWLRREAGGSASSPQVRRLGGREEPLAPAPPAPLAPPRGSAAALALL